MQQIQVAIPREGLTPEEKEQARVWESFLNHPCWAMLTSDLEAIREGDMNTLLSTAGLQEVGHLQGRVAMTNYVVNYDKAIVGGYQGLRDERGYISGDDDDTQKEAY